MQSLGQKTMIQLPQQKPIFEKSIVLQLYQLRKLPIK